MKQKVAAAALSSSALMLVLPVWPPQPLCSQASVFSFFLFFFRKDGVRNFFFFLVLGDLEGELSGDSASSIFSPERTVISTLSTLVVS